MPGLTISDGYPYWELWLPRRRTSKMSSSSVRRRAQNNDWRYLIISPKAALPVCTARLTYGTEVLLPIKDQLGISSLLD